MKNFRAADKSHAGGDEKHDINFHWPKDHLLIVPVLLQKATRENLWVWYTSKNFSSCSKSANKLSTNCIRTTCPKLLTICNNLVDIIRLVARLFQQARDSHDVTILLQPCVVNLVTFLLHQDCIRLVRTTL
jgi:hypothetical protein